MKCECVMARRVLLTATVQSHICQFHKPLMSLLKENDYEIHVAARDNLAEKNGLQLEYPDRVFDVPFARSPLNIPAILKAAKALSRILRENRYDVIHCNTPVAGVVTRMAARRYRKTGTKVLYTAHGFHFYKGAPKQNWIIYYPIEKWMSRYTDTLITITDEDYRLAKKKFHCRVVRMHGVGANSQRFEPVTEEEKKRLRGELGVRGNPVIMNVGELLPNKNQKTAITMMPQLLKQYPDAYLLIAGNGPEKENLETQIRSLGLTDHIRLLGYTTEVDRYVKTCDVLVACSFREGMPLNVMEAMLCGKPVVASNNRGHRELVRDGVTGYLVEPEDVGGYADRICRALKAAEAETQGRDGRQKDAHETEKNMNLNPLGAAGMKAIQPFTDKSVRRELQSIYSLQKIEGSDFADK